MRLLWTAHFDDGNFIEQPEDDRYSKHDDNADWNPTAFKDIQEYDGNLAVFSLYDGENEFYSIDLRNGLFKTKNAKFSLEGTLLTDRKLIYFREMEQNFVNGQSDGPRIVRYAMGYEGKNSTGKVEKKVIYING